MRTLYVAAIGAVMCLANAQRVNLSEEPKLRAPIRVWLKMEPMRDALQQIGEQTGVPLRCQDAIAQEKVAVFVESRPAHEVLTQIARLFRYEWRAHEDGGYILYVPDATRRAEERLARAETARRRATLQATVQHARELTPLDQEALRQEYRQLEKTLEQPGADAQPDSMLRFRLVQGLLGILQECPDGTSQYEYDNAQPLIHCLATLNAQAIDTLTRGQTLGFSTRPPQQLRPLPLGAKFPEHLREERLARYEEDGQQLASICREPNNPAFCGLWLRFSPVSHALECQQVSYKRPLKLLTGEPEPFLVESRSTRIFELPLLGSASDAELQSWQEWATPAEQWTRHIPAQRRKLNPQRPELRIPIYRFSTQQTPVDGAPLHASAADALEWLAFSLRKPVVADAFRTVHFWSSIARLYQDEPQATLQALASQLWLRFDESGYLMARTRGYWQLRSYELPESWLRPLEQKYRQQGRLDWNDYIELAGKFTDLQARYYRRLEWAQYPMPAVEFEWEPMAVGLPALRFLASLPAAVRPRVLANEGWQPVDQLTPLQQQRFLQTMSDLFPPDTALFIDPPEVIRSMREYAVADASPRIETVEFHKRPAFRITYWTKRSLVSSQRGFRGWSVEVDEFPKDLAAWLSEVPDFAAHLQETSATVYAHTMECIGITFTDGVQTVFYKLGQSRYEPLRR
ncbi:MAG: hypothetical protein NZ556_07480 [Fimbriimonadales bacterium]|nr:hypothetical protein [Fimbriimonadales bacterium]